MSSVLFVLGAGASAASGAPVMRNFLDVANDLWRLGRLDRHDAEEFSRVSSAISALTRVHSKARLDHNNIESVFAAFEMARTIGYFAAYSTAEIDHLLESMRTVIAATLQWTQRFPIVQGVRPPEPYGVFASLLRNLAEKAQPRETVSVVTFNYDLGLDYAIQISGLSLDYSLDPTNVNPSGVPLLKLHGSLNWRECPKCHAIVPITADRSLTEHFSVTVGESVRVLVRKAHARHCDSNLGSAPVLVPPTWNKTEHHRQISPVWGRAARELSGAENIFVMGYSLPDSDAFFRYLYALGSTGDSRLRRFWVYDIDESGDVERRFRSLLGPGAEDRFQYIRKPFEQALPHLSRHFNYG